MFDLYGMSSPNVLKIMLLLEELGADYRILTVNLLTGEQFEERFERLNPMRKVPVLIDPDGPGGEAATIFESAAILLYLAEKYGQFMPYDRLAKYDVLQWLMVEAASAGPLLGQLNHFLRFAPDNEYALGRYRTLSWRAYDMFDQRLRDRDYMGGGAYSIADMAAYPWVEMFYEFHGMDRSEHPNLARWRASLNERSAVARALARYRELSAADPTFSKAPSPEQLDLVLGRGKFARL